MARMSTASKYLKKKARIRSSGYPIGTIAYYGPTDKLATKVAVGIKGRYDKLIEMKRWYTTEDDIRLSAEINEQIVEFLQQHEVHRVAMMDRIIGCPHEQGVDYEGDFCPDPECTFWQGRDRWTGELYS